jgi:hypothetical protein
MAALTPSLAGLSLKPAARPRVPTGADLEDNVDPPPPPAPMRAPASTGPVLPLAQGGAGPSTTDWVTQAAVKREELKRKATEALEAADEVKRQRAEVKAAEKAATAEAKAQAKAAADAAKAAERAAAAQAKAEAKAEADAAKADAKAEAAQAKAEAKAEADAAKAEAAQAKAEAKAEADAAKAEAAQAKAEAKAEEDARDEEEAAAEGITVKTLKARRTKLSKAASEAGYASVAEYQEALEAEEAAAQAAAQAAERARAEAAEAQAAAEAAEARRLEQEEACVELEEQIHRLRWQQRSMADDYAQMLREWQENNCGDPPSWMGELDAIFQKLSSAIQDAEDNDPVSWEISEGGKHAMYADKFADEAENEAMEVDGEEGEEGEDDDAPPEGYTVTDEAANALAQGKAKGRGKTDDDDDDMDVDDDTIQIDLRVTLQNVRDDSEETEKWRTQVITTDYENGKAAYVTAPDPQPDNPNATKLVRSNTPTVPYPSDIPQAFIDDVHAEVNALERATKGMASAILNAHGGAPASLLASVSAAPMTAFDGASNPTTQQNLAAPKGKGLMRTLYAIEMHLPANVAASREQANRLVEGFLTATMDDWSNASGLRVVQVSGVQDMESYMEGIFKQQKVQDEGPLTKDEVAFMAAKFGPKWKDPETLRPDDRMKFLEMYREQSKMMDQQENIKRAVADQRQVGAGDDDANRVLEADGGGGGGGGGGGRRKLNKGNVQRRDV